MVQASGGTLFLDDIGDMPVALQTLLLRMLQERQVTALDSNKRLAVDLSITCATHAQARHPKPAADVLRLLQHDPWPGNLRRLFNLLRTAAALAGGEPPIIRAHMSDDFLQQAVAGVLADLPAEALAAAVAAPQRVASPAWSDGPAAPRRPLEALEIAAIRHAVDGAGGHISDASKRLGISHNTIDRKLRWNLPAGAPDGTPRCPAWPVAAANPLSAAARPAPAARPGAPRAAS